MKRKQRARTLAQIWVDTYGRGVRDARVADLMRTAGYVFTQSFIDDFGVGYHCQLQEVSVLIATANDRLWGEIK